MQIHHGRYVAYHHKALPYLDKIPAPKAIACCIQICLMQRIASMTPEPFYPYKGCQNQTNVSGPAHGERGFPIVQQGQAPLYILYTYLHIYIYLYVCDIPIYIYTYIHICI